MIEELLHDMPVEYRGRFALLLEEDDIPTSSMRRDVQVYLSTVKQVGLMVKLLDIDQASALAATALALLDHADQGGLSDDQRRVVQAGVRYFVVEEEDEEVTGVLGFDDDLQVLNAVSRALGRHDLILQLSRRHAPEDST